MHLLIFTYIAFATKIFDHIFGNWLFQHVKGGKMSMKISVATNREIQFLANNGRAVLPVTFFTVFVFGKTLFCLFLGLRSEIA
jgi:hypothetical protein